MEEDAGRVERCPGFMRHRFHIHRRLLDHTIVVCSESIGFIFVLLSGDRGTSYVNTSLASKTFALFLVDPIPQLSKASQNRVPPPNLANITMSSLEL
jgi:hypothetical protein